MNAGASKSSGKSIRPKATGRMHNPPHPGGILKRQFLKPLNLNVTDTAKRLKVSRKQLSQLLNERSGFSPQMALKVSVAFDTTPELWLNLQRARDLWEARKEFDGDIIPFARRELVPEGGVEAGGQKALSKSVARPNSRFRT